MATTTISTKQLVGQSYAVRINNEKVGIVSKHSDGWHAVAGSNKLGTFPTKVQAVDAVADRFTAICSHPGPAEFGASEVSWDGPGLIGHVVVPCRSCGELIDWQVEE